MSRRRFVPASCHPDRMHEARELCRECYTAHRWAGSREQFPRTTRPSAELVAQALALRAELEAAAPYSDVPATWGEVAARLGVRPKTLERARQRVARTVQVGVQ